MDERVTLWAKVITKWFEADWLSPFSWVSLHSLSAV
jgi:hypothetical protein